MIFVERQEPLSREQVDEKLAVLEKAVAEGGSVREAVASVVPTFCRPEQVNREAEKSMEMQAAQAGK